MTSHPAALPETDVTAQAPVLATRVDRSLLLRVDVARLDAGVAGAAKAAMKNAVDDSIATITVDLRKVDFIDSSGLGALVTLRKHAGADRTVRLVNLSPFVAKVLTLTKLVKVFED